jgi:hypothetical protein
VKLSVGDDGPVDRPMELLRERGGSGRAIEVERGPTEPVREDASEDGMVGARTRGCCRIRLRPEAPRPCSWSVMTGDLGSVTCQLSEVVVVVVLREKTRYSEQGSPGDFCMNAEIPFPATNLSTLTLTSHPLRPRRRTRNVFWSCPRLYSSM